MPRPGRASRLALTPLEDRTVPTSVTVTRTATGAVVMPSFASVVGPPAKLLSITAVVDPQPGTTTTVSGTYGFHSHIVPGFSVGPFSFPSSETSSEISVFSHAHEYDIPPTGRTFSSPTDLVTYAGGGSFSQPSGMNTTVSAGHLHGLGWITFDTTTTFEFDYTPTLAASGGLVAPEGQQAAITSSLLSWNDSDTTPAGLVYTILAAPVRGTLYLDQTPLGAGSTFTQADVDAGLVAYLHDGSETTGDGFSYDLRDANNDPQTGSFDITVTPINDRPVLDTVAIPVLPPHPVFGKVLSEGGPVAHLTEHATDDDLGALKGIAVVGADTTNGQWQFKPAGGDWTPFPAVTPEAALLLDAEGAARIRFVPRPRFTGYASLTFKAWDQTNSTTDTTDPTNTAFSAESDRAWVAVGKARPVVDADGRTLLKAVKEGTRLTAAVAVKDLVGLPGREDGRAGLGMAVTAAGGHSGTWEYKTPADKAWHPVPATASPADPFFLNPADKVRFAPQVDADGEGVLGFRTWDPAPGADPSLWVSGKLAVDLVAVNDAPVLDPSAPAILNPVTAAGQTTNEVPFASLMRAKDIDTPAAQVGVAVFAATGPGTWQYNDGASGWQDVPKVSPGRALLLAADAQVRFVAGAELVPGTADLSFKAWDGTTGQPGFPVPPAKNQNQVRGTAFSKAFEVVTVAVGNQAPRLADTNPVVPATNPSAGVLVSALLGTAVTDTAGTRAGIAVVGADTANGTWEYSLDGRTWKPLGSVSESAAVLLGGTSKVRFVPASGVPAGTTARLSYKAWDQAAGRVGDMGVDATGPLGVFSTFTEEAVYTFPG